MSIKLQFDSTHTVIEPSLILAIRGGDKQGKIPYKNLVIKESFGNPSELSFDVYKADCHQSGFWEKLTDFKLIWVKEWNLWFEMYADLEESSATVKHCTATDLGNAELSQINLYDIQINTEDAIENAERLGIDYQPIVFYTADSSEPSVLRLLLEKAPHYRIGDVSATIRGMQRTFHFDDVSIRDAMNDVAEEVECHFEIVCETDDSGALIRTVNAYDLNANCVVCRHRGAFFDKCPECGSTNVVNGYGDDTTILISTDNLADTVHYKTDEGSVKNCFKLIAGDDLMTATVVNATPSGSDYLWFFSDAMKADMSEALKSKLAAYESASAEYESDHAFNMSTANPTVFGYYNSHVANSGYVYPDGTALPTCPNTIYGHANLMLMYYDLIDVYHFLKSSMMPASASLTTSTAETEKNRILDGLEDLKVSGNITVAVENITSASISTASSVIRNFAQSMIDKNYKVTTGGETYNTTTHVWTGTLTVQNYSDEDDVSTTNTQTICVTGDEEAYTKQRLEMLLGKQSQNYSTDIVSLFKMESGSRDTSGTFDNELKKYSLERLVSIHDACQSCIDILLTQGITEQGKNTWGTGDSDPYMQLMTPYKTKLAAIEAEMSVRDAQVNCVYGVRNDEGGVSEEGMMTIIERMNEDVKETLNMESYFGADLWHELCSFRRESTYRNENYISDGLSNEELFEKAVEFFDTAKREIYSSVYEQHSIDATVRNLLMMKEFEPLVDSFEIGNFIRVKADGGVHRLRLLEYELDLNEPDSFSVTFSDVVQAQDGFSDLDSVFSSVQSMSSSYGGIVHQAKKGEQGNRMLTDWVYRGLSLTAMKIVNAADDQSITMDNHGLLCREYRPSSDTYSNKQVRIINNGLYYTTDNWNTIKSGIGNFWYYDPSDGQNKEGYGVIADTIVGNIILGDTLGIYNTMNSFKITKNGVELTTATSGNSALFTIKRNTTPMISLNNDGRLVMDLSEVHAKVGNSSQSMISEFRQTANEITSSVSKYDPKTYTIDLSGSGTPAANSLSASENNGKHYLNISNGDLYSSNGTSWTKIDTLNKYSSQITQNATDITSKVSYGDQGTYITQNASSVQIAWNDNSNYIRFEEGMLNIYASLPRTSSNKLMSLNENGMQFFNGGNEFAKIGLFDWSETLSDESVSTLKCQGILGKYNSDNNSDYYGIVLGGLNTSGNTDMFHAGIVVQPNATSCTNYIWGNTITLGRIAVGVPLTPLSPLTIYGTIQVPGMINGMNIDCYRNIDLQCLYSVLNSSDVRLKEDISETKVDALSILNQIEMKEYKWIQSGTFEPIGIIAQQIMDFLPEVVHENDDDGKLSLRIEKFIPYLIRAIQQLSEEIGVVNRGKKSNDKYVDSFSKEEKAAFCEIQNAKASGKYNKDQKENQK